MGPSPVAIRSILDRAIPTNIMVAIKGVWEKLVDETDDGPSLSSYLARATELVYNKTNGEPMFLSMAKSVITLNDDDDDDNDCDRTQNQPTTFTGVLNILRSPCVINDCPVPDMSLVDTDPMFVINITGTKILGYNGGLLATTTTTMAATQSSSKEEDDDNESNHSSSASLRSSSSASDGMSHYRITTTSSICIVGMLLGHYFIQQNQVY